MDTKREGERMRGNYILEFMHGEKSVDEGRERERESERERERQRQETERERERRIGGGETESHRKTQRLHKQITYREKGRQTYRNQN